MKVAAPSFGTRTIASAMKIAPNSPPLHAHQGMQARPAADGIAEGDHQDYHAQQADEVTDESRPGGGAERAAQIGVQRLLHDHGNSRRYGGRWKRLCRASRTLEMDDGRGVPRVARGANLAHAAQAALAAHPEELAVAGFSKDEATVGRLMVLPAMRSIVRRRRISFLHHSRRPRVARPARVRAPPHHEVIRPTPSRADT